MDRYSDSQYCYSQCDNRTFVNSVEEEWHLACSSITIPSLIQWDGRESHQNTEKGDKEMWYVTLNHCNVKFLEYCFTTG